MVQAQHKAVDLEQHQIGLALFSEVSDLNGLPDGARQRGAPDLDAVGQRIPDCAGAVVEFDRAGNENTAGVQFADARLHPEIEHALKPGQAPGFQQSRLEDAGLEATEILPHHLDLELLAGSEMGKDTAFAHAHAFGDRADRQALEPLARRELKRNIEDGRTGERTLGLRAGILCWPGSNNFHRCMISVYDGCRVRRKWAPCKFLKILARTFVF